MDVRTADESDVAGIREAAQQSFRTSYSLSPGQIETILEEVFSEEALADRIGGSDGRLFVTEGGDETDVAVSGFAEIDEEEALRWLHVHPNARGLGSGSSLVEAVRAELDERGVPFTARVLEEAREGSEFLEQFGLKRTDSSHLEVGGEEFAEQVYTTEGEAQQANEPVVDVPERATVGGDELPVDRDERIPGTEAPFFEIDSADGDGRAGFFCSNCGSTNVAVDTQDRLECGECGNQHRADNWDAAYL